MKLIEDYRIDLIMEPNVLILVEDDQSILIGNSVPESNEINDRYISIDKWDLLTRKMTHSFCNKKVTNTDIQGVDHLLLSEDKSALLSGHSTKGAVQMWDFDNPQLSSSLVDTGSPFYVRSMAIKNDSVLFIDGKNNQYICDIKSKKLLNKISDPEFPFMEDSIEHESEPNNILAKISPSGNFIGMITPSIDHEKTFIEFRRFGDVKPLWKIDVSDELASGEILFAMDESKIFIGGFENEVRVLSAKDGSIIQAIPLPSSVDHMAISPDGKLLGLLYNPGVGFQRFNNPYELLIVSTETAEVLTKINIEMGCVTDIVFSQDATKCFITWAARVDGVDYNQLICYKITS